MYRDTNFQGCKDRQIKVKLFERVGVSEPVGACVLQQLPEKLEVHPISCKYIPTYPTCSLVKGLIVQCMLQCSNIQVVNFPWESVDQIRYCETFVAKYYQFASYGYLILLVYQLWISYIISLLAMDYQFTSYGYLDQECPSQQSLLKRLYRCDECTNTSKALQFPGQPHANACSSLIN